MGKSQAAAKKIGILEHRAVAIVLSGILFVVNFISLYFTWIVIYPESAGFTRIALCWAGAYALTWVMTSLVKGSARLVLTLILITVLYVMFYYRS